MALEETKAAIIEETGKVSNSLTVTALRPVIVAAMAFARYFRREDPSKQERIKQAFLDADLILQGNVGQGKGGK